MLNLLTRSWMFLFALLVLAGGLLAAAPMLTPGPAPAHSNTAPDAAWTAAALGRVEPRGREIRISAPVPGVIKDILVAQNDPVQKGDLLIRLDDEELAARLAALKALAAVKTTDRDDTKASGAALDRRKAEDALYNAERRAFDERMDLDRLALELKAGKASIAEVQNARAAVTTAAGKVYQEQQKLRKVQAKTLPAQTKEEAALAAARAEVAAASAALERMRIRAPLDASVLELNAKTGEVAGPASESPLLMLGDTAHLQVRAEVEERDVSRIYAGQAAIVRSDAFPDRTFDVRVSQIAKVLGAPQLSVRNRRKQTDVEILEVVLDLEEGVPLLPGMRVDVMFREAEAMQKSSSAGSQQKQ